MALSVRRKLGEAIKLFGAGTVRVTNVYANGDVQLDIEGVPKDVPVLREELVERAGGIVAPAPASN